MANLINEYNLQTKKIEELMLKQSLQTSKTDQHKTENRRSTRIASKVRLSYFEPELEKKRRVRIKAKKEEAPIQVKDSPKETKIPSPIKEMKCVQVPTPKKESYQEIQQEVDPTYRPTLYICDQCGLSYIHKGSLTLHQKQKKHRQSERIFQSYSQDTDQKEELQQQPKFVPRSKFECSECGQIYTQTSSLYLHQRKKHKGINFNREFFRTRTRRRRETDKSEQKQRIKKYDYLIRDYDCEICGNSYTQQSSLNLHQRLKHNNSIRPKITRSVVRLVNEKPYYEDEDSKLIDRQEAEQKPQDEATSMKVQL